VSALKSASFAVNVSVAVDVPELLPAAANVVVPHPSIVSGDAIVPIVNVGSTSAIVSACFSGTLSSNEYEIDDLVCGTARPTVRLLYANAGSTTCVDDAMVTAAMLPDADGNVAPTLRVESPAACATLLLVTPLATDTVHCAYASSVAVAAVRVSVAVLVVESLVVAVNVVVPHEVAVTPGLLAIPNVGNNRVILSVVCTSGVLSANMNEMADGPSVTGLAMVSTLCWNAGVGATNAVDNVIAVVALAMFFAAARVTPTLRLAAFKP
jgi:hypothetical protein